MLCKNCGKETEIFEIYCDKCRTEIEKEIEKITEEIKKFPDNAELYFKRGDYYSDLGQTEEASYDFDEYTRLKPNDAKGYFYLAQNTDNCDEEVANYIKTLELAPHNEEFYNQILEVCSNYDNPHYYMAIRPFEIFLKHNPDNIAVRKEENKIYEEYIDYYNNDGNSHDVGFFREYDHEYCCNRVFSNLMKIVESEKTNIQNYKKLLKYSKEIKEFFGGITDINVYEAELENSLAFIKNFNNYKTLKKTFPFIEFKLKSDFIIKKENGYYKKYGFTIDDNEDKRQYTLCPIKEELVEYFNNMMLNICEIAIKTDTSDSSLYYEYGFLSKETKDYNKAIEFLGKALELAPEDNNEAYLHRGLCYEAKGQYDKAVEDYIRFIKYNAQNDEVYLHRGNIYFDKKNYKKALEDFKEYLELNPDDNEVQYAKKFAEILTRKRI